MDIQLLPFPRKLDFTGTYVTLGETFKYHVSDGSITDFTLTYLKNHLKQVTSDDKNGSLELHLSLNTILRPQAYHLEITSETIKLSGGDQEGVHYGVMTVCQLLQQFQNRLPIGTIEDFPDFPARGVMLDISRDKVPTMETLFSLVDMFMEMKINQLQLYTEHTFAYQNHEVVWKDSSPMTAEEIRELDAYCKVRFIELVPNQNCFGHMTRWLKHDEYKHLAEAPDGWTTPWHDFRPEPFSLSPTEEGSIELIAELFDELLPNFSSNLLNVGCDETWDVGQGKSKDLVEELGGGRVYLDYLMKIYEIVKSHGKTMMFWGDIINQHPDLVPEIPRDTIALEWWYEDVNEYMEKSKLFADSGIPFYVCPGTSSWATIAGRTQNCIANIQAAVEAGLEHGAIGVLNTDWGDLGHWQPLPVSYLGYAYGAAASWCYQANRLIDLPAVLDLYIFKDKKKVMGKLAYDLGNAYLKPELTIFNGSLMFWMYHDDLEAMQEKPRYSAFAKAGKDLINDWDALSNRLQDTTTFIHQVIGNLEDAEMQRDDASLIESEFVTVANMLLLAIDDAQRQINGSYNPVEVAQRLDAIEKQYRANWLARNRSGGLDDSVARFNVLRQRNLDSDN